MWKLMKEVVIQDLTGLMKNVEKVQNVVHSDSHLSVRAIAMELNLDKGTVRQILSYDLGMKSFGRGGPTTSSASIFVMIFLVN
jgi:hypothetical protein